MQRDEGHQASEGPLQSLLAKFHVRDLRAILQTAGVTYAGTALSLFSAPLLARTVGADGRGVLAAAFVTLQLLSWVGFLGLPRGLALQRSKRGHVAGAGVLVVFLLGLVCAVLAIVFADSLSNGDSRIALGIRVSAIALVLSGVGQVGVELMLLEGRLVIYNITRASVLMLPSLAIIVAFFTGALSLISAYIIMLAGQLIAVALGCIFALKNGRRSKATKVPWDFSLKYWSTSALDAIGGRGDQVALSALSQASTVGVYSLAVTCAAASAGLTEALNNLAYSRLTRLSGAESEAFLRRRSVLGVCCSLISGACIVVVVHFFGRSLFGPTFDGLTAVVIVLVLAQTVGDQWSLRVLADSAKETATTLIFASVAGLVVLATVIALLAANAAITSVSMALAILLFSLTRLTIWTIAQKRKNRLGVSA